VPAAGLLAGLSDLSPLGYGWYQDTASVNAWMLAGTIVDTLTLPTIVGLLALALVDRRAALARPR
jgi:hypothetical protein